MKVMLKNYQKKKIDCVIELDKFLIMFRLFKLGFYVENMIIKGMKKEDLKIR